MIGCLATAKARFSVLVDNLRTFVANICGEHLWRTFAPNICGEHLWRTFVANICAEHLWRTL
jgi:hypothetical protein